MTNRQKIRRTIAIISILGFFGLLIVLARMEVPQSNRDPYNILLGALSGVVTTIVAFYFGDSESNGKDDEQQQRTMDDTRGV